MQILNLRIFAVSTKNIHNFTKWLIIQKDWIVFFSLLNTGVVKCTFGKSSFPRKGLSFCISLNIEGIFVLIHIYNKNLPSQNKGKQKGWVKRKIIFVLTKYPEVLAGTWAMLRKRMPDNAFSSAVVWADSIKSFLSTNQSTIWRIIFHWLSNVFEKKACQKSLVYITMLFSPI